MTRKSTNFSLVGALSVPDGELKSMKSDLVVVEGVVCSCIIGSWSVSLVTPNITDKEQAKDWLKNGKALGMNVSLN
jgi:hypothetical protein